MIGLTILFGALGAAMGSFAALVAERLLRGEDVVFARSRCVSCGTRLRWRDLIPLLSWPLLRGRCAQCKARIPAVLWQAEIIGAAMGVVAASEAPGPGYALLFAGWMWTLLALALADLRRFRLPDPLVALAALLGLGLVLADTGLGWMSTAERLEWAFWGAVAGGGSFWAIRVGYRLVTGREGMGLGDIKLMAALGLVLGPDQLPLLVLIAALAALAVMGLRTLRKGRSLNRLGRVPFGAALSLAAVVLAVI